MARQVGGVGGSAKSSFAMPTPGGNLQQSQNVVNATNSNLSANIKQRSIRVDSRQRGNNSGKGTSNLNQTGDQ